MKITIAEHQDNCNFLFADEKEKIDALIGFLNPAILHIGSTSYPVFVPNQ